MSEKIRFGSKSENSSIKYIKAENKEKSELEKALDVNLQNLERKIQNKATSEPLTIKHHSEGEDERRRANRNMGLEKISDNSYAVKSYGFSMEFKVDSRSRPYTFFIDGGNTRIQTQDIEKVMSICNLINFGMFTVKNAIKDSSDYLNSTMGILGNENTKNKDSGNIFTQDDLGNTIMIKANPKDRNKMSSARKLFGNKDPKFYGTILDNDKQKRHENREYIKFITQILNYKTYETFLDNKTTGKTNNNSKIGIIEKNENQA